MRSATDMSDTSITTRGRNIELEEFAAELTSAVYPMVLRRQPKESWVNLELGLWNALAESLKKWDRQLSSGASPDDLDAYQEALLVALTGSALCVVLKSGVRAPLLEMERDLSSAIRQVIGRFSHVS